MTILATPPPLSTLHAAVSCVGKGGPLRKKEEEEEEGVGLGPLCGREGGGPEVMWEPDCRRRRRKKKP